MRNLEVGLVDFLHSVEEKVEIDRPRAALRDAVPDAPEVALDREQRVEQRPRGQTRLELDRPIEKPRLIEDPDRLCVPELRGRDDLGLGQRTERVDRQLERPLPVAEVRTDTHVCPRHRGHRSDRRYALTLARVALLLSLIALAAPATSQAALVQVTRGATAEAKAAGGSPIASELRIWRVPDSAVPSLRAEGVVVTAERERVLEPAATALDEPLAPEEWWRSAIGADVVTPPGPGKPVTVVDTGLDVTHEEFASRPNTTLLNTQTVLFSDDDHGTEVSSVIAAPVNGVGLAGVYPQAALRSWDASPFGFITTGEAIRGIVEAARRGIGVINLSFGGEDDEPLIHQAVLYAFKHGSLVVASSGNDGLADNPLTYPASYPHVLTVAATASSGFAASFSSRSRFVDLAAPGSEIPVAEPTLAEPTGYDVASGTSFSAPLVSGAAAWVWTARPQLDNTQLFDVMRFSAHDIDARGFDDATGNGLLDIPAALRFPAPPRDPLEPNENIDEVAPKGLFNEGQKPILTPTQRSATVTARLDRIEDPNDVYRAYVHGRGSLAATVRGSGVELRVYGAGTRSISARPLARGTRRVSARNASRSGGYMYIDVRPTAARPSYVLRVTSSARP